MMRCTHLLLSLAAVILGVNVLVADPRSDETATIAKIELLGGRVEQDLDLPGRPVVSVDFQGSSTNKFNDKYLHLLTAFSQLTSLNVSGTKVSDAGLDQIGELKSLTTLLLAKTSITDAGLAKLAGLHELTTLSLRGTSVSDHGIKELGALKKLTSLNLRGTHVTDEGLMEIGKLENLQSLYLIETRISDGGLVHLSKLTKLKTLALKYTPTTFVGQKKLKEALPNLEFQWPMSDAPQIDRPLKIKRP